MYLTYDIVRRVPAHIIHKEHRFGSDIIAAWGLFCRVDAGVHGGLL